MPYFDAHLDLAYLAECGRNMTSSDLATCGGPHPPAAVTIPSLRQGRVTACLGTIFTQAVPDPRAPNAATGHYTYPLGDADAAHRAGLRQLDLYHQWQRQGHITLMPPRPRARPMPVRLDPDTAPQSRDRSQVRSQTPLPSPAPATTHHPLRVGILMECADPIRSPDELPFWADRGVVAIGLAWAHGSRYAAGNGATDPDAGLTDLGRALITAIDALGLVHDLSHLSQRATDQLLELTDAPVIASHSNCRALFDRDHYPGARQRHLDDPTIREIARRGGVIGLNLFSDFLDSSANHPQSAPLPAVLHHVDHLTRVAGSRNAIGLGTDMDGGFAADRMPQGIRCPADLASIDAALAAHGWSPKEITNLSETNWRRFWSW